MMSDCTATTPRLDSAMACAGASMEIAQLLRVYATAYSVSSAPYSISYSTYISATILVRLVAQMGVDSAASNSLRTCLHMLREHQILYSAAKRARTTIERLMQQMSVVLDPFEQQGSAASRHPADRIVGGQAADQCAGVQGQVGGDDGPQPPAPAFFGTGGWTMDTDFANFESSGTPAFNMDLMAHNFDVDAMIQSFGLEQTFGAAFYMESCDPP